MLQARRHRHSRHSLTTLAAVVGSLLLTASLLLNSCTHTPKEKPAKVVSCNDGDTCRVLWKGEEIKVRLSGIDAPETTGNQPYWRESRDRLRELTYGKEIQLKCDGSLSFGRRACTITADGVNVQEVLVQEGLAIDSPKYSKGKYQAAEVKAKAQKLGQWSGKPQVIHSPHCWKDRKKMKRVKCLSNSLYTP